MKRLLIGAVRSACDQSVPPSVGCPDGVLVAVSDYSSSPNQSAIPAPMDLAPSTSHNGRSVNFLAGGFRFGFLVVSRAGGTCIGGDGVSGSNTGCCEEPSTLCQTNADCPANTTCQFLGNPPADGAVSS